MKTSMPKALEPRPTSFRHLPSRLGQPPTPAEVEVFTAVAAHLSRETGPLPLFLSVSGIAAVAIVPTRDSEGWPCVGLVVELSA